MTAVNRHSSLEPAGKKSSGQKNMSSHTRPRSDSVHHDAANPPTYPCFSDAPGAVSGVPQEVAGGLVNDTKGAIARIAGYNTVEGSWTVGESDGTNQMAVEIPQPNSPISEQDTVPRTLAVIYEPRMNDRQVLEELCQVIEKMVGGEEGTKMATCFLRAGRSPPITKKSLSELDIAAIISNPKLRHDVNFDRELHFRPNLDGVKGRLKMRAAEDYWVALTAELELYQFLFNGNASLLANKNAARQQIISTAQRRIPRMFGTIRDILKNLVPERDQARVEEQLDVSMLMLQIEKGVCNLVSLSKWLAYLLKAHCAPMRDEWVEKMVKRTEHGVETGSARSIVNGLTELLGILEAMKLDVANHQIRHLRPLLIENTINFEHRYHLQRIKRNRIDVQSAADWYWREASREQVSTTFIKSDARTQLEIFLRALVRLLLSDDPRDIFPETFYLDFDRLRVLKAELHDLVYFEICCEIFDWIVAERLGYLRTIPDSTRQALRDSLFAISSEGASESGRQWASNIKNIAVELVRQALGLCGYQRSSDGQLVQVAEKWLLQAFDPHFSDSFAVHEARLENILLPRIAESAERHINSSSVDIFNVLIAPTAPPPPPPPPPASTIVQHTTTERDLGVPRLDLLSDIARRVTHIAVLHWRIWAPLVYIRADGQDNLENLNLTFETPLPTSETSTLAPPSRTPSPGSLSTSGSESEGALHSASVSPIPNWTATAGEDREMEDLPEERLSPDHQSHDGDRQMDPQNSGASGPSISTSPASHSASHSSSGSAPSSSLSDQGELRDLQGQQKGNDGLWYPPR